jgi:hypothetical protein
MYWNIFHDFTLKEFHELQCEYDIMFFAETNMLPGEDEAADVPAGYKKAANDRCSAWWRHHANPLLSENQN